MTKYLIALVIFLNFNNLKAQTLIKKYVEDNTVPITTIDPDSTDFFDLQAIGNAIGNSRIVMLGEQGHGDAPTFLAKTRLIKYLHEKKGFNVLAFESDFFGLNEGWDNLPQNKDAINSFLMENIFRVWAGCDACNDLLYQYIPNTFQTHDPLQISGIDCQMFIGYSHNYLFTKLDSVWISLKLPITQKSNYATQIFPALEYWYKNTKSDTLFAKRIHYLNTIKNQMEDKLPKNDFWIMAVNNLISENIEFKYQHVAGKYYKNSNVRDSQMAENLKWLCEVKYPNQKIIVWAHNIHVSKYNGHYPQSFLNQMKTMGGVFTSDSTLMNETYILGFTSYEGTAGRIMTKHYELPKPKKNSLENWIPHTDNYAFVDFKPFREQHPSNKEQFYMAGSIFGNSHHTISKAQWDKIFDGVFFIRKMYPCKLIER